MWLAYFFWHYDLLKYDTSLLPLDHFNFVSLGSEKQKGYKPIVK